MITLHHLENSRSQRVLWMLEELGVDYRIQRYARDPKSSLAPPELRAVHPLGKSPVITDGERTLAESGAIIDYLAERYGDGCLRPDPGTDAFLEYRSWLHYAEGSAMPMLLLRLVFSRVAAAPAPFFVRPVIRKLVDKVDAGFISPQLRLHFDYVNAQLEQREWFAGDRFSGADVQMSFPLEGALARGGGGDRWPAIVAFVERIRARPAWQRALEAGGAYELMR